MSREQYDPICEGCKPVIVDVETGEQLSDDSAMMKSLNAILGKASSKERKAYHRVMCLNSRTEEDLRIISDVMQKMKAAMANAN